MGYDYQVTFDAADPAGLARFWAVALDWIEQPPPEGFSSWDEFADSLDMSAEDRTKYGAVVDPDDQTKRLLFQKVPEGKTAKNRVHLDIRVSGGRAVDREVADARIEEHVARLTALGATELGRHSEYGGGWVVMADPEGNEFCVT